MPSAYPGDFYPGQVYPSQLSDTEEGGGTAVYDTTTPALAVFALATTHRSLVSSASIAAFLSDPSPGVFATDPQLAGFDNTPLAASFDTPEPAL